MLLIHHRSRFYPSDKMFQVVFPEGEEAVEVDTEGVELVGGSLPVARCLAEEEERRAGATMLGRARRRVAEHLFEEEEEVAEVAGQQERRHPLVVVVLEEEDEVAAPHITNWFE